MAALHGSMEMSKGETGTKSERGPYHLKGDESRPGIHPAKTLHLQCAQNNATQQ